MLAPAMSQTAGKRAPLLSATQAEISSKSAASEKLDPLGFVSDNHDCRWCIREQDRHEGKPARRSRTTWRVQQRQPASISLRPVGGCARLRVGTRTQLCDDRGKGEECGKDNRGKVCCVALRTAASELMCADDYRRAERDDIEQHREHRAGQEAQRLRRCDCRSVDPLWLQRWCARAGVWRQECVELIADGVKFRRWMNEFLRSALDGHPLAERRRQAGDLRSLDFAWNRVPALAVWRWRGELLRPDPWRAEGRRMTHSTA
eukprot:6185437-Pleurochrysis_carterae.AAC.2